MTGARRRRDDRGVTLVELLVVMSLMTVFGLLAVASVGGVTDTAATTQSRSTALDEARRALEVVIRDMRAANPIEVRADVAEYDDNISFDVYCELDTSRPCPPGNFRAVVYQRVGAELRRTVDGSTGSLLAPRGEAGNRSKLALVNTAAQPVFQYFDADGDRLLTNGAGAVPATRFRDCTKTVRIDLRVLDRSRGESKPLRLTTDVALRNWNEVSGC